MERKKAKATGLNPLKINDESTRRAVVISYLLTHALISKIALTINPDFRTSLRSIRIRPCLSLLVCQRLIVD